MNIIEKNYDERLNFSSYEEKKLFKLLYKTNKGYFWTIFISMIIFITIFIQPFLIFDIKHQQLTTTIIVGCVAFCLIFANIVSRIYTLEQISIKNSIEVSKIKKILYETNHSSLTNEEIKFIQNY